MIKECRTVEDFNDLLSDSHDKPVFLFKHSTRCPISAGRWREFQGFAGRESRSEFGRILVIEDRPLSTHVARETGVRHQSPQAILFHKGEAVWNTSHYSITAQGMSEALDRALSS